MTQALTLPSSTSKGGSRFSPAAVQEAIELLCLTGTVEVKASAGTRRRGAHRYYKATGHHSITVSTYLCPEDAGRTLWHELCHAAQVEYLGVETFNAQYSQESAWKGYRANAFEVEARSYSDMNDDLPLARQASRY